MAICWRCSAPIGDRAAACPHCHANQASLQRPVERPQLAVQDLPPQRPIIVVRQGPNSFQSCMGCVGFVVIGILGLAIVGSWIG